MMHFPATDHVQAPPLPDAVLSPFRYEPPEAQISCPAKAPRTSTKLTPASPAACCSTPMSRSPAPFMKFMSSFVRMIESSRQPCSDDELGQRCGYPATMTDVS